MPDKLIELLKTAKAPWWLWLLLVAAAILTSSSKKSLVKKELTKRKAELELEYVTMEAAKIKHLEARAEAQQKIIKYKEEIADLNKEIFDHRRKLDEAYRTIDIAKRMRERKGNGGAPGGPSPTA